MFTFVKKTMNMNILQAKKKLRDLENSFIRDKRTGILTKCYWNKMIAEDIDKLIKFIEDEEIARVDIETTVNEKAEKVIMNYLTDGNPEGDFTKSTIGADDKKAWYIKGIMDCLREMNCDKSYQSKLEFILPIKDTVGKIFAENADLKVVIEKPTPLTSMKCDICGCHPNVIITTQKGTFCTEHAKY